MNKNIINNTAVFNRCFDNYYILIKSEYIKAFFINYKISIFNLDVISA